jgi:cell fate (sporulation/competence/biofilm development) regulator YlbF (YheA/YmcA/DUF963 family)
MKSMHQIEIEQNVLLGLMHMLNTTGSKDQGLIDAIKMSEEILSLMRKGESIEKINECERKFQQHILIQKLISESNQNQN